jgi:hypothetical protein
MYSEELLLRAWQLRPCFSPQPLQSGSILLVDWLALEHNIIHSRCRNFDMYGIARDFFLFSICSIFTLIFFAYFPQLWILLNRHQL